MTTDVLDPNAMDEDSWQIAIRPKMLADFVGQPQIAKNLRVFVDAASRRREPLDHVLLSGPPGLGKTTLSNIIANELGYSLKQTAAPAISKAGDIAAILTGIEPFSVLFIDEIHRLPMAVEEMLYSAMEDFRLDFVVGEGAGAKTISIDLPPFTLVGATTRPGALSAPLRDRFGIDLRLEFYDDADLARILVNASDRRGDRYEIEALQEIARRARSTPRIAHRLLRRARDFALNRAPDAPVLDLASVEEALTALDVDANGLDRQDRNYLTKIFHVFEGGPVGAETLAASLSENVEAIETLIEPYLLNRGYIARTPRGRIITAAGKQAIRAERRMGLFPDP